jgi:hypothetical protein
VIRLSAGGLCGSLTEPDAAALREQFDRDHCVKIEGFLAPDALAMVQRFTGEVAFVPRVHDGIGAELCLPDGRAVRLMFFLVNDPALFAVVRQVTGCARIGCFTGRLYRMAPGAGNHDSWHSDVVEERMIGMSVNLGGPYQGGVFQIRERESTRLLGELPNIVPGDAILFRIDERLQHWITPIAGHVPKTAFAGWFRSAPEFLSLVDRDDDSTT